MNDELPGDEARFLQTLRRNYARLAAWMARGNRNPDPNRLPDEARIETANRTEVPPRQPAPPRP
jgi:hypothetical protein